MTIVIGSSIMIFELLEQITFIDMPAAHMRIHLLTKQTPWYGTYSGYYEQVPRWLESLNAPDTVSALRPRSNVADRAVGKAYAIRRGWPNRNQSLTAVEMRFGWSMRRAPRDLHHILNLEEHLLFLEHWVKAPTNLVGTIHFPRALWQEADRARLRRLSSAIVLYRADMAFFESHVGAGRVKFVPHGVDTEFFHPLLERLPSQASRPRRLVFAGQYLRNIEMLRRVIMALSEQHRDLAFDLVVAEYAMHLPGLDELREVPSVSFHQGISDEALRSLYQNAYLMLLPMTDSGANNAVVEALACGLPIVTTRVGGIADYGGDSLYPVVGNDDDAAMIALIEQYLDKPKWRDEVARAARAFAETQLSWPRTTCGHLEAYQDLITQQSA